MKFRSCVIRLAFAVLFLLKAHLTCYCQDHKNNYPTIGDKCPDFALNNLFYFPKKTASYADFKGKPIILNFFSTGCGSSFETLPYLKEMQKEFEGRVQFIMIGRGDNELKKQYEKYRLHYHLDFPVDFDDSLLWNKFGVYFIAHTIWIDSTGIIRQITTPFALNKERVENLVMGKPQMLTMSKTLGNFEDDLNGISFFDREKPYLINGNGGNDTSFFYRSIFSKWDYRTEFNLDSYISSKNANKLIETGASLETLYKLAYGDTVEFQMPVVPHEAGVTEINTYPEWSNKVLLESKQKELFDADYYTGKNIFTYSLEVPADLGDTKSLQLILQRELKNYFNFNARVETRIQPCWKLKADPAKIAYLKTKGGAALWKGGFSNLTLKNMPVSALISNIYGFNQDECTFLDETGINGNIDLEMDCIWTDLNDVKKELRKNGLDLVKGEKELKVLVIKDSN